MAVALLNKMGPRNLNCSTFGTRSIVRAQQLTRLLDDLLDVSRITSGKIGLVKERIDLRLAVVSAVESTTPADGFPQACTQRNNPTGTDFC